MDGSLRLQFTRKEASALQGKVFVGGPYISGTGDFEGSFVNGVMTLKVHPSDGTYTGYTLRGQVGADGSITGTIDIPATLYTVAQSGQWEVRPVG